jgi:hypothetical protein
MSTTSIIIFVLLIIISMMMYYCLCDKKIEGFNTAGSNQNNTNSITLPSPSNNQTPMEIPSDMGTSFVFKPYSESNTLTVLSNVSFFDPITGCILFIPAAGVEDGEFIVILPNKVSTAQDAPSNLFVTEFRNNLASYTTSFSADQILYRTDENGNFVYAVTRRNADGSSGSPTVVSEYKLPESIQPTDSISHLMFYDNNGFLRPPTDKDISYVYSLVYSRSTLGINDSTELGEGLLMKYDINTGRLDGGAYLKFKNNVFTAEAFNVSQTITFTNSSTELSKMKSASSLEQKKSFTAVVSSYNQYAALQAITDSVFFDPLTHNFVHLDNSGTSEQVLIYNVNGESVTYNNEPNVLSHWSISPWTIVDNKNRVVILVMPPANTSGTTDAVELQNLNIRCMIVSYSHLSGTTGFLYLSHYANLLLAKDGDILEKIKIDRANQVNAKPLPYYTDEIEESAKTGNYGCVDNGIRYFSHDSKSCVMGTYDSTLYPASNTESSESCNNNNKEVYDVSMNVPSDHVSDYYKWMWYWKSKKYEEHNGLTDYSDYILKSSVVPPVCPTCPTCPTSGICSNCGGNGGGGTQGATQSGNQGEDTDGDGIIDSTFSGINKVISGTGDAASNVLSTTGGLVGDAASAIGGSAESVIGKTYGAGKTAVGDVYGAGKSTVGDVYGAGKTAVGDVYGETKNVLGDVGEGLGDAADATGIPQYLSGEMENAAIAQDNRKLALQNEGQALQNQQYSQQFGTNTLQQQVPGTQQNGQTNGNMMYGSSHTGAGVNTYSSAGDQQRVVNPAVSNMNYMGRLPSKGHDKYIPITADFSSFGR